MNGLVDDTPCVGSTPHGLVADTSSNGAAQHVPNIERVGKRRPLHVCTQIWVTKTSPKQGPNLERVGRQHRLQGSGKVPTRSNSTNGPNLVRVGRRHSLHVRTQTRVCKTPPKCFERVGRRHPLRGSGEERTHPRAQPCKGWWTTPPGHANLDTKTSPKQGPNLERVGRRHTPQGSGKVHPRILHARAKPCKGW